MIRGKCPSCHKQFEYEDYYGGMDLPCKSCGVTFTIPEESEAGAAPPDRKPESTAVTAETPARPARSASPAPERKGRGCFGMLLIGCGIVFVVGFIACGGVYFVFRDVIDTAVSKVREVARLTEEMGKAEELKGDKKHLGDDVNVNGYVLNPPPDYRTAQLGQLPKDVETGKVQLFAWDGAGRPDNTAPRLIVTFSPIPEEDKNLTLPAAFPHLVNGGVKSNRTNFTHTPAKGVKLNGQVFLSTEWTADGPTKDSKMHGLFYASIIDGKIIGILWQDSAPHHTESLPRGRSTVASFRKK